MLWTHDWEQPCDEDLLVARAESVSVVGALPPDEKAVVLDRIRALVAHASGAGRADLVPVPLYDTGVPVSCDPAG